METKIPDFYILNAVTLKSQKLKALPKQKLCRYNIINERDENDFNNDLKSGLDSIKNID